MPTHRAALSKIGLKAIPALLIVLVWHLVAVLANSIAIPRPVPTLVAVVDVLADSEFWAGFLYSNRLLLYGFLVSAVVGVVFGLVMGRLRTTGRIVEVWMDIAMVVPIAAIIPIVVMALGLNVAASVLIIVLFGLPMIAINSMAGVREIDRSLVEMSRSLGASERQLWRYVLLPGASPAIWAGLRIGLGRSVLGMLIVELLLVAVGLGRLLQIYRSRFDFESLFALVLIVVVWSILLIAAARELERRMTPWSVKSVDANNVRGNR